MRILLTNDDGILADGLQVLAGHLAGIDGVELHIVAPERERSATGHAITLHKPLRVQKLELSIPSASAWAVSGTPADCTKLGVGALLDEAPDLVISGINRGSNLGTDVYYSGTVSAAMEGAFLGIPALAISLAGLEGLDYTYTSRFTAALVKACVHQSLAKGALLNINVPQLEVRDIAGLAVTRLGFSRYRDSYVKRTDPRGQTYYWLAGDLIDESESMDDTDISAIHSNLISITPICLDLTNHTLLEQTKRWVEHVILPGQA